MHLPAPARRFAAAALAALAACAPRTSPPPSPTAAPPAVDPARLATDIRVLASDAFLGRGPATAGEDSAVRYIVDRMRAAGLAPGGPNGSWTQEVPLLQADIQGTPDVAVTVGGRRRALAQGADVAIRASLRNVDRVEIADAPLVFLGYGVRAPERRWDDFKGEDLRGRVGLVLVNDPDFETGSGDFGGRAMTYYGRWTYKYEEAARQGLAGLLIVHETAPAAYGWATVRNSNTNTMFDVVRADPAAVHPWLEGWVQRDVAAELLGAAGLDFEALKRQARTRDFRPVPLPNARFSARYAVRRAGIRSRNVLGRLTGASRPAETVLFGAHWDHLGVGLPDARGDSIYNGAVDNATGVAALLELARLSAAGPRPARSLLFAAWTVEEKGLLGSEYYAANPVYPLETTAAGFNVDALMPTGPARDVLVVGAGQSDLEDRLARALAAQGRVARPDQHPEAGYFFRSDHFPLAKRGVPMLYLESGSDLAAGGRAAGDAARDAYERDRYHQPADQVDASWRLDGIAQDVALLARLAREVADAAGWPNYRATSEFRPARDASAARRAGR